jgi:hypothetical protein
VLVEGHLREEGVWWGWGGGQRMRKE